MSLEEKSTNIKLIYCSEIVGSCTVILPCIITFFSYCFFFYPFLCKIFRCDVFYFYILGTSMEMVETGYKTFCSS
jgi:hypothetical protein